MPLLSVSCRYPVRLLDPTGVERKQAYEPGEWTIEVDWGNDNNFLASGKVDLVKGVPVNYSCSNYSCSKVDK